MKFKLTVLFILFCTNFSFPQDKELNSSINKDTQHYIEQAKDCFEKAQLYDSENLDSAALYRHYIHESLQYYEKVGITANHSHYNLLLGISILFENKIDSALIYLKRALKPYQKNPDISEDNIKKRTYALIMQAYMVVGQHDSAFVYGHEVLKVASVQKDSATMAKYQYFIGTVCYDMERTTEALEYFKSAAQLAKHNKNYDLARTCYGAAAMVINVYGDSQGALPMADSTMKYARIVGEEEGIASANVSLAAIYNKLERYDDAIGAYEEALQYYEKLGNNQLSDMTRSAMGFIFAKTGKQKEAFDKVSDQEDMSVNVDINSDSLILFSHSYRDLKRQLLMSQFNTDDKTMKFDVLYQEYLERQAASLRQLIWFISLLAVLIIVLLLLLYNRQRQKAKTEAAARRAEEKEKEYLALQKETDLRMMRKYIDGLESERSRISKELHDGICNDLLALELELKNSGKDVEKQAAFLQGTRESIRNVSHELMPPAFQYATIDEILSDYIAHYRTPDGIEI